MENEISNNQYVQVKGTISNIKQLITRKGKKMAIFTLKDEKVVVFPDNYEKAEIAGLIIEDQAVIVSGQLDTKGTEPQMILEKIEPLKIRGGKI